MDKQNTDELIKSIKEETLKNLHFDRQRIIAEEKFIGTIAMRMQFVPVRDKRVRTACTDGKRIFVDISYYNSLGVDYRVSLVAHEVWHVVMMHFGRLQNRDETLFNIASDMEVNNILKHNKFKIYKTWYLPPYLLEGHSAEEIYEYLLEHNNDNDNHECCDEHIYSSSEPIGKNDDIITDEYGEVEYDDDFKPFIEPDTAERIRDATVAAEQLIARTGRGTLPYGAVTYIHKMCQPELSWKEIISQFVTTTIGDKNRWLPPSKRDCYRGLYLPSRYSDTLDVCVAFDTSGSTSMELRKFMSELVYLLNTFGNYKLTFLQCDAEVQSCETYDEMNRFPVDDIESIELKGLGGSSTIPVFEYIEDNDITPNCLIYFTDGLIDAPENPPQYPVLWIITRNGDKDFCSWGEKTSFK